MTLTINAERGGYNRQGLPWAWKFGFGETGSQFGYSESWTWRFTRKFTLRFTWWCTRIGAAPDAEAYLFAVRPKPRKHGLLLNSYNQDEYTHWSQLNAAETIPRRITGQLAWEMFYWPWWPPSKLWTVLKEEIIYEQSMVEANDEISGTELALPGAMASIRRTATELGFGYMENLEVSGSIAGFLLISSLLLLDLGPV